MFFAWAHVFFFPFHKPNYYECAFFLAKPTTHARVVRHTILKRNGKKKPWAQTNNSLPNNHVRHNEASFNSTKWRCPYDNVTYCKFTPNRKQLPKQLPPPLHMARTWMDMHRLRRLHDSQYIMENPFTNENSNLSNIFHNNIHRKKVESLKVRSTEEFLCQFAWLPCRFFRGRRQGRQPLNNRQNITYIYIQCTIISYYIYVVYPIVCFWNVHIFSHLEASVMAVLCVVGWNKAPACSGNATATRSRLVECAPYVYIYICVYVYIYMCIYILYVYIYILYVYIYTICIYIYTMCLYIYYVYIYIYILYIYIYTLCVYLMYLCSIVINCIHTIHIDIELRIRLSGMGMFLQAGRWPA